MITMFYSGENPAAVGWVAGKILMCKQNKIGYHDMCCTKALTSVRLRAIEMPVSIHHDSNKIYRNKNDIQNESTDIQ